MSEERLPTALWVEAHLHRLTAEGRAYYILHKGEYASGMVLVKINALDGTCVLLQQQRDFMTDMLGWVPALNKEIVEESEADAYIRRAVDRDPDLWVVEVEDRDMKNPFEEDLV